MSVKRKKAGLVISWQKSFSLLAPWRKGKGDRDAVLDREVVLTKMKLFSNFHKMLPMADDSASTISTVSVSEQDIGDPTKASEVHKPESGSEHMSVIFSDSQLTRLYKFESEDSGVELPSGTNSPSTLTSSEQSFIVHSRESSCNLNSDPGTLPDELVPFTQLSEIKQALDSVSPPVDTLDNVFIHSDELSSAAGEEVDGDQSGGTGIRPERDEEMPGQLEETCAVTERTCFKGDSIDTAASGFGPEPPRRRSDTSDSLEEYMDQCCRLSEAQQASCHPLGSGLDYLDHICQLIARIGQLQENNLQLERQICSLQKDGRMAKTKEDFFQHHCSCGAACLTFQDIPKRQSRSDFSSLSGTLSDLSTIHEVSRPSLLPARGDMSSAGLTPVPLWRTSLYRRSYTEGEVPFLGYSTEQRRPSENYTWGRVKDLVRKTKVKNQSRLRLTSASLKRSCPQLYMPDVEPFEPACSNRNSMIALGHHSKLDIPWLQ
ncbi:uncharacterized protein si:ch211-250c4.3 [Pungitius pungitius]|uniref:uncharacterized protein si:ch211-250c4.3 n=1 Tax=Pungitius pungitius TaxID=134920 RepID=UPI001886F1A3|nr:uncharacterized protein si:ch211-250c4.3 [Pungitius pungitius]